jgi:hypothetical protein
MTQIVIPLYYYPPYKGVGVNRWFHLCNQLRSRHNLTIYTPLRIPFFLRPPNYKTNVRQIPCDPLYLLEGLNFPWPPLNKIKNHCLYRSFSHLYPVDFAQYWFYFFKHYLHRHMSSESIFILTGAPFSFQLLTAQYLIMHDYHKFILDFRDPFSTDITQASRSDNPVFSSFSKIESQVLLSSLGKRVFVTDGLVQSMAALPSSSIVIENGHPFACDFSRKQFKPPFSLVYFGTLANGRDDIFINFLISSKEVALIESITIYGRTSLKLCRFLKSHQLPFPVHLKQPVSQAALPSVSRIFDFGLQINSDFYPYLLSTKLYEYPALGLPVLCLADISSHVYSYVLSSGIGASLSPRCFSPDNIHQCLLECSNVEPEALDEFALASSWYSRSLQYSSLISSII